MDRKLGRLGLAACLAVTLSAMAQNVTDEVDRFSGQRKLGYVGQTGGLGQPTVTMFAHIGGKVPLNGIRFMVAPPPTGRYASQRLQYTGCNKIEWLVDGKPLELGMVVKDVQRYDRLLVEFVTQEASTEQLETIGRAQTVEYRICGVTEGTFSVTDIAAAKGMAETIRQAGSAAVPAIVPTPSPAPAQSGSEMKYRPKL